MVSGAVAAPLVMPRQIQTDQPKGVIDTNTVIEMNCPNYTGAHIYYTTDGSRPTARVSKTINTRTHRYNSVDGILLRQGKRTVKALCCLPDGRESNIVTKDFYVKWVPSESDEESDYEEEIARTIEASRAARQHSQQPPSQMTTRTMSGRHSVGGSHLVKMSQVAPYTTRGISAEFDQYTATVPRVVNTIKMNATTGPVNQLKEMSERFFLLLLRRTAANTQKGPIGTILVTVHAAKAGDYQLLGTVHLNPIISVQPAALLHINGGIGLATFDLMAHIVAITARVIF